MRKYKSGSKWALWRWSSADSDYIRRLHLIMTPWFAICVHFIRKPDVEPHLHDHPVTFLSLVLKGWYREWRQDIVAYESERPVLKTRRWYNFIRASFWSRHRICEVAPGGCITIAFMTRVKRQWGFHAERGWVYWKDYYAEPVNLLDVHSKPYRPYTITRKEYYQRLYQGKVSFEHDVLPVVRSDKDAFKL